MIDKKTDNLLELEYFNSSELLNKKLLEWANLKPDNKDLDAACGAACDIFFYVNRLQVDRRMFNKVVSEFRTDKIRAIERAQKAESKIRELEKKIQVLNKQKELGL